MSGIWVVIAIAVVTLFVSAINDDLKTMKREAHSEGWLEGWSAARRGFDPDDDSPGLEGDVWSEGRWSDS